MASTETSPEPDLERVESPGTEDADELAGDDGPDSRAGFVQLLKDLADDTRTLVQQEMELARLEVARSVKRVAADGAWIGAGAVVLTVGLVCLALALALGLGELLGSYFFGTLITAAVFLLLGGLFAWRGIRDLSAGGLLPTGPVESLQEDRDWARQEMDELKDGLTEET